MKIVIFHFKLNNLLNWIKMTHFELNNILNWITKIIKNWIIFWIEFSWNDFESNIELNQFWAKFKHWIESIWVSDRAIVQHCTAQLKWNIKFPNLCSQNQPYYSRYTVYKQTRKTKGNNPLSWYCEFSFVVWSLGIQWTLCSQVC